MKINWPSVVDLVASIFTIVGIVTHLFGGAAIESIYYFTAAIAMLMISDRVRDL